MLIHTVRGAPRTVWISTEAGPLLNLNEVIEFRQKSERCWGPDRRRSGPRSNQSFLCDYSRMRRLLEGSRFSADSQCKGRAWRGRVGEGAVGGPGGAGKRKDGAVAGTAKMELTRAFISYFWRVIYKIPPIIPPFALASTRRWRSACSQGPPPNDKATQASRLILALRPEPVCWHRKLHPTRIADRQRGDRHFSVGGCFSVKFDCWPGRRVDSVKRVQNRQIPTIPFVKVDARCDVLSTCRLSCMGDCSTGKVVC